MEEIWKNIEGYEGIYQVSDKGNIKSLSRKVRSNTGFFITKEKILRAGLNSRGYYNVVLYKNLNKKVCKVHQLVAIAFLNHIPDGTQRYVVDHINDIKTDNRLENLQVITQRENSYKTQGKYSSQYKGVTWHKQANKWASRIRIGNKQKHIGLFKNELDAKIAYENELIKIKTTTAF